MSPTPEDRYRNSPRDQEGEVFFAAGGDPDAQAAELSNRFRDRLRFFAARRLRDRDLAEDVAQETLRRVLEALRAGRVENLAALPAFLFETARHICQQRSRSDGREAAAYQRLAGDREPPAAPGDALADLISEERRQAVRGALAKLEESDQILLSMSYVEGLGAEEIGRRLKTQPGAVRVRRHRAIRRLAEILGVTKEKEREPL